MDKELGRAVTYNDFGAEEVLIITQKELDALKGLGHEDAVSRCLCSGIMPRYVSVNGHYVGVTRDRKENRINLEIQNGKVVNAYVG